MEGNGDSAEAKETKLSCTIKNWKLRQTSNNTDVKVAEKQTNLASWKIKKLLPKCSCY